ncbi:hypothetical protein M0805_003398 [Coniferiporia weirii]|nr:hypothetical protein M0805_003398 [Coniferiporia weirii]
MLKRQRPSTPPASIAEMPSGADSIYGDSSGLCHNTKRRRVLAPALDGRQRGMHVDQEWSDEDAYDSTSAADYTQASTGWEEQAGQYKHANILLHQLHLEHQRRAQTAPYPPSLCAHAHNASMQRSDKNVLLASAPGDSRFTTPGDPTPTDAVEESNQIRARYEVTNRINGAEKNAGARLQSKIEDIEYCCLLTPDP